MFRWILIESKQLLLKKKTILLLLIVTVLTGFMVMNEAGLYQTSIQPTIRELEMNVRRTEFNNMNRNLELQYFCSMSYEDFLRSVSSMYESIEVFEAETGSTEETFNEEQKLRCNGAVISNPDQELLDSYLSQDRRLFVDYEMEISTTYLLSKMNAAYALPQERIHEFFESEDQLNYYKSVMEKSIQYQSRYTSVDELGQGYKGLTDQYVINYPAIKTDALHKIIENDLPYIYEHELTPSTVILYYFQYYAVLLILFVIILGFDSIYSDMEDGSIKTILSGPGARFKYYIVKSISILIVAFIVTILPILVLSLCLGITQGFDSFMTPTFAYNRGYTRLLHDIPYEGNSSAYMSSRFTHITNIGLLSKAPIQVLMGADSKEYIPMTFHLSVASLGSMVFMTLLLTLLQTIFVVSLNMFTSIVVKTKEKNIMLLVGLFGVGYGAFKIWSGSYINMLNPFSFLDVLTTIQGASPFTYLNAVITLILWITVLQVLSYKTVRKVDIQA